MTLPNRVHVDWYLPLPRRRFSLPRYSGGGSGRGSGKGPAGTGRPPPQPSPGLPGEGVALGISQVKPASLILPNTELDHGRLPAAAAETHGFKIAGEHVVDQVGGDVLGHIVVVEADVEAGD